MSLFRASGSDIIMREWALLLIMIMLLICCDCSIQEDKEVCAGKACSMSVAGSGDLGVFLQTKTSSVLTSRQYSEGGVPHFVIDLDLPPRERLKEQAKYYRELAIASTGSGARAIDQRLGKDREEWLQNIRFSTNKTKHDEYMEELKGYVETINHPNVTLERVILSQLMYEFESPTVMCGAVLLALPNGTVMHGRNMDYSSPFTMSDGTQGDFPNITFVFTMVKNGQPIIKGTGWPGSVGFHTAMRIGGWSFEQNTRLLLNHYAGNFEAFKKGGLPYGTVVREIMETEPDFLVAVDKLKAARLMAPQYFIMAGSSPYQGAVLTIDRLDQKLPITPPTQLLSKHPGSRHLVQTNFDLLAPDWDFTQRQTMTDRVISEVLHESLGENPQRTLTQLMHTPPLYNDLTVFTTVMVPATGLFETTDRGEGPKSPVGSMADVLNLYPALLQAKLSEHDDVQSDNHAVNEDVEAGLSAYEK